MNSALLIGFKYVKIFMLVLWNKVDVNNIFKVELRSEEDEYSIN